MKESRTNWIARKFDFLFAQFIVLYARREDERLSRLFMLLLCIRTERIEYTSSVVRLSVPVV